MEKINLIKNIAPEIIDFIERRYLILRNISYNQPIGRRKLSVNLGIKERTIREDIGILKELGFLNVDPTGMYITDKGDNLIKELHDIYIDLIGISTLEENLREKLNIKKVIIVPGNSTEDEAVLKDMGKTTFEVLKNNLNNKSLIGITGGSTMASVAKEALKDDKHREVIIIPARGGLGKDVNTQSNSIAAKLADKLGGMYRLLYIPDGLGEDALKLVLKNKEIKESIDLINDIDTLVFGLGRADTMAERRDLDKSHIKRLLDGGAVAEAFGHYFNIEGKEIWEYSTIGLTLDKFKTLKNLIGVAGGEEKAEAIISIATLNNNMTLITDESAAKNILNMV